MLTQTTEIPKTPEITEIIMQKVQELPPETHQQILDYLEFLAYQHQKQQKSQPKTGKRIAGLHKGKGWISDDFNEPIDFDAWNWGRKS
jgi:hypothetical protein